MLAVIKSLQFLTINGLKSLRFVILTLSNKGSVTLTIFCGPLREIWLENVIFSKKVSNHCY